MVVSISMVFIIQQVSSFFFSKEADFTKPSWNKSTTTNLLSQNPPPSVIHIGESQHTVILDSTEEPRTLITSESIGIVKDQQFKKVKKGKALHLGIIRNNKVILLLEKDEFIAKLHTKCKRESERLRDLLDFEKAAKRYIFPCFLY